MSRIKIDKTGLIVGGVFALGILHDLVNWKTAAVCGLIGLAVVIWKRATEVAEDIIEEEFTPEPPMEPVPPPPPVGHAEAQTMGMNGIPVYSVTPYSPPIRKDKPEYAQKDTTAYVRSKEARRNSRKEADLLELRELQDAGKDHLARGKVLKARIVRTSSQS